MTPPTSKSSLAIERPWPLTAGNWATNAGETAALMMLVVLPGWERREVAKVEEVRLVEGRQG